MGVFTVAHLRSVFGNTARPHLDVARSFATHATTLFISKLYALRRFCKDRRVILDGDAHGVATVNTVGSEV